MIDIPIIGECYMRILFIEPPKDIWFVMGEYVPPPYGIIQLAAYLEKKVNNVEIDIWIAMLIK